MSWNYIVIITCIVLALFAMWKEWRRVKRSRLLLRLIAVVVAIAALACIALPLKYQGNVAAAGINEAVLITPGFNSDSLGKYNTAHLFTTDRLIIRKFPKAVLVNDMEEIRTDSSITQLRILGDGLDAMQLQQLNLSIVFHPEEMKVGLTSISWNGQLKTGERLVVQGEFKNASAQKLKLILSGLSTNLDSAIIKPNSTLPFNLTYVPKNNGKAVYNLLAISGKDTVAKESIPVQIEAIKPLKILMLTASPDFEIRFLKNWLSENGYAVAGRSAISKGKFNTEFINMEQTPLDRINAALLNKFDMVLGDLSVLKSLNVAENGALKQEVEQAGMGLIIRADSTNTSSSWLQSSFPIDRITGKDTLPASLMIMGQSNPMAKLSREAAYITYQENTQPLVRDIQGHFLSSAKLAGAGKLIFTSLNNTYSWMLAGNKADYTALWTMLINKATRKRPATENWSVTTSVPVVSVPIQLQLASSSAPLSVVVDSTLLSTVQDPYIPFEWNAVYYPQSSGWYPVKQGTGADASLYIYADHDWKSIRALKKQADTRRYAAENTIVKHVTKQIQQKTWFAVPKIYFYILLLLACSFLWAETKMT